MSDIILGDIRYNARAGAFEARVDIRRGDTTFRYPCVVPGPVTLDDATVRAGLARHAMRMSDSGADLYARG